jgi:hypothetical protein
MNWSRKPYARVTRRQGPFRNAPLIDSLDIGPGRGLPSDAMGVIASFANTSNFNNLCTRTRFAARRTGERIPFGSANATEQMERIFQEDRGIYAITNFDSVVQGHFETLCDTVYGLRINFRLNPQRQTEHRALTGDEVYNFNSVIVKALVRVMEAPHLASLHLDFHTDTNASDYRRFNRVRVGDKIDGVDQPILTVLAELGRIPTLHTLDIDLTANNIDDDGLVILAQGLQRSPGLHTLTLRLSENAIGARGAEALARHLILAPALTTLCLHLPRRPEIDSMGYPIQINFVAFCNLLKNSPRLRVIELITAMGVVGTNEFDETETNALLSLKDAPELKTLRLNLKNGSSDLGKLSLMRLLRNKVKSNDKAFQFELKI